MHVDPGPKTKLTVEGFVLSPPINRWGGQPSPSVVHSPLATQVVAGQRLEGRDNNDVFAHHALAHALPPGAPPTCGRPPTPHGAAATDCFGVRLSLSRFDAAAYRDFDLRVRLAGMVGAASVPLAPDAALAAGGDEESPMLPSVPVASLPRT